MTARPRRLAALIDRPFAHRGLWRDDGPPENSLSAFRAAHAAGLGAELDVRLSADGEAMVFHDDTLARMTGAPGAVIDHDAAILARTPLIGADERIPLLDDVLAAFPDLPLLIELKTAPGEEGPLETRVAALLHARTAAHAIISFNPYALAFIAQLAPEVPRGQLTTGLSTRLNAAAPYLDPSEDAGAALAEADFLCCHVDALHAFGAPAAKRMGMPLVTWTVRTPAQLSTARTCAQSWIFEALPVESVRLAG